MLSPILPSSLIAKVVEANFSGIGKSAKNSIPKRAEM
jgi:hypothetical protein